VLILTYLIGGLVTGCLYALTATGMVVTYTTSGIFNFAHGAIGMFMAFTYWQLAASPAAGGWGWPVPVAMAVVLLVFAPLAGALIERLVIRPLYGASLSVRIVVTLGLMLGILGISYWPWDAQTTRYLPTIFGTSEIHVFGLAVPYYDFLVFGVSIAVAVGLRYLFTRTRIGLTMRAVVDDRDLTSRAGASPYRTSQLSWALGASLAALAGILIAPLQQLGQLNLTFLVVVGFSAAVVGRLKSLPLTVAGAMILGLTQSYAVGYLPVTVLSNLNPSIPTILLFFAVLFLRQDQLAAGRPAALLKRKTMGLGPSLVMAGGFVAIAAGMTGVLGPGNLIIFNQGIVLGIVMLSLVLVAGYGGQVSLCQMTLAGFGAYAMGKTFGGGSLFGLVASVLVPAAIACGLSLAVVRLRGLYLALATLAFAEGMDNLFFQRELGYGGELHVGRFLAQTDKGFCVEVAVIFAALAVGVLAIKRSRFGRQLAALNDSEAACASIGMSIRWTKVAVFTIAGGIAGLGGALYGGAQQVVSPGDFQFLLSLTLLLTITLAGIDTVAGAFAGAVFLSLNPVIIKHVGFLPTGLRDNLTFLLVGLGAVSLGRNPGGITGQINQAIDMLRDAGRRLGQPAPSPLLAATGGPSGSVHLDEGSPLYPVSGAEVMNAEDRYAAR
jgi:branched-chain amino acid transport system permease protein